MSDLGQASQAPHTGGCLCGKVKYRVATRLSFITHCHCSMCRRHHGAAFATHATVGRKHVSIDDPSGALRYFASSPDVSRGFCAICGSSLFWQSERFPKLMEVVVATLDDEPEHRPVAHIHVASKLSWLELCDDLPRHEGSLPGVQPIGSKITTE